MGGPGRVQCNPSAPVAAGVGRPGSAVPPLPGRAGPDPYALHHTPPVRSPPVSGSGNLPLAPTRHAGGVAFPGFVRTRALSVCRPVDPPVDRAFCRAPAG